VLRRRRRVLPTRSRGQKCNRAAATNEAAHLSKYRRAPDRRQRSLADVRRSGTRLSRSLQLGGHPGHSCSAV
jgi:hypothetical protein